MAFRLIIRNTRSIARALGWSITFTGALWGLSRLFNEPTQTGWFQAAQLSELSEPPAAPPYLPDTLTWPPNKIYFQNQPEKGWWIGLSEAQTSGIALWMGTTQISLPAEIEDLAPCLTTNTKQKPCPEGWHASSSPSTRGQLTLISRLNAQETKRILIGLEAWSR